MFARCCTFVGIILLLLAAYSPIAAFAGPAAPLTAPITLTSRVVDVGYSHSCAVRSDGGLQCWGDNTFGQRNNEPTTEALSQVSVGNTHACALKQSDDTLICWGGNGYNQLDNIPTGAFKAISAGYGHNCAIRADGTLACWGDNFSGQSTPPTGTFVQVGAGQSYTCAIRTDATMACWGAGAAYATAQSGTFKKVSASSTTSCAIRTNDTLLCWGDNTGGKATAPSGTFRDVDTAFSHTCGVRTDGTLQCWGDSYLGRAAPPGGTFTQVSSAYLHNCALTTASTIICWGNNTSKEADAPGGGFGSTANIHRATTWTLGGNAGTVGGPDYVGTVDNQPLVFKVNGARVLRLEPNATSPNIFGGSASNTLTAGVFGATLDGGGTAAAPNAITDNYGTVGGGAGNRAGNNNAALVDREYATVGGGSSNRAGGAFATVPGGSSNEAIGTYAFAAGRNAQATTDGSFVWADSQTPKFPATAANQFSVRATGGTRIVSAVNPTTGAPTAGVQLAAGGGSWATLSDRNAKTNIVAVDGTAILDKLAAIPIALWNYRTEDGVRHIGPMAQDFAAAFGVGEDRTHITTVDADGVALAAIQGLNTRLAERDATIQSLEGRIATLERSTTPATSPWIVALVVCGALVVLLLGVVIGMLLQRRPTHA